MSVTISGSTGISTIPNDIVTTDKILDTAVTAAKLDSGVLTDYEKREAVASTVVSGAYAQFSAIPAWAKRVTLVLREISLTGTDRPIVQFGDSSTDPGVHSSGYDSVSTYGTTASTYNFTATSSAGFVINSNVSTNAVTGTFVFTLLDANAWVGSGTFFSNSTTSVVANGYFGGLSNSLSILRIAPSGANTFDGSGVASIFIEG